jgi:regulator of protease activity HflC (stomatin/prohibitin superfamily)
MMMGWALPVGVIVVLIFMGIRVLNEYERGVVLRLGKYVGHPKGPGIFWIIPFVDKMLSVDLRLIAEDVPPQDIITKDNVSVKVNAVVYFRVVQPEKAVLDVFNYRYATSQLAQTTLRSILGQNELDELLSSREKINNHLQEVLDRDTDSWGIKVSKVELKHVDLPQEMQRAMAKQAEAERERRAKIINADAELQASRKLTEAAKVLDENPAALQLRYLQTLVEVSSDRNSTTVIPFPLDILRLVSQRDSGTK